MSRKLCRYPPLNVQRSYCDHAVEFLAKFHSSIGKVQRNCVEYRYLANVSKLVNVDQVLHGARTEVRRPVTVEQRLLTYLDTYRQSIVHYYHTS